MSIEGYVLYQLLWLERQGLQPYIQCGQAGGMEFEGGYYHDRGRYLGYLKGDAGKVEQAVAALKAWLVQELTSNEALAWAEGVQPINTQIEVEGDTKYVGPAEINEAGRVARPLSDTPWEV